MLRRRYDPVDPLDDAATQPIDELPLPRGRHHITNDPAQGSVIINYGFDKDHLPVDTYVFIQGEG